MHLAKGLELRVVAVMACDDEVLPLQARIENVADDGDVQEVYDTEPQLLLRRLHAGTGSAFDQHRRAGVRVRGRRERLRRGRRR